MSLILRNIKGSALTFNEMDGNFNFVKNLTEVTYSELNSLISDSALVPGMSYKITDYRTCYDRPDYDIYKSSIPVSDLSYVEESVDPIIVFAISNDKLALDAYQPSYPKDKLKYDVTYTSTESGGTAYGRITERIDALGNRTDYDWRTIRFKRYRLIYYSKLTPLDGTIELLDTGVVNGLGTLFTSLSVGNVIAVPSTSEKYFEIVSIDSDILMAVTGSIIPNTGSGLEFFSANTANYDSYYANNVDGQSDFELYYTFEAMVDGADVVGTWVGDHSTYYLENFDGEFLLANNVFKDGDYLSNVIGDSSYNNTFNDDNSSNQIGYAFRNNIIDDDFDGNVIADFFNNNIITANFQYNKIGRDFENNVIINSNFYRNQIGNDFRNNWLDSSNFFDFQNNVIGNQFNNNTFYDSFYKNHVLNGFNVNTLYDDLYGNKIGNGYNGNTIYSQLYDNQILDYFSGNTIGTKNISQMFHSNIIANNFSNNTISGYFYKNNAGNNFQNNIFGTEIYNNTFGNSVQNNVVDDYFAFNTIGNEFSNNNIADYCGFGGGQARGNKIGNRFQDNTIGEYFYDNIIFDRFTGNIIGEYFTNNQVTNRFFNNNIGYNFQNNDVKVMDVGNIKFDLYQGIITSKSNNNPAGTDGTYIGLGQNATSGFGAISGFDVVVSGGVVDSVTINSGGIQHKVGDVITIFGSNFGGTDGVDLLITVTTVTTPLLNKELNCTIVKNSDYNIRLCYLNDVTFTATSNIHS